MDGFRTLAYACRDETCLVYTQSIDVKEFLGLRASLLASILIDDLKRQDAELSLLAGH
jgi:hypothetical protein